MCGYAKVCGTWLVESECGPQSMILMDDISSKGCTPAPNVDNYDSLEIKSLNAACRFSDFEHTI